MRYLLAALLAPVGFCFWLIMTVVMATVAWRKGGVPSIQD